MVAGPIAKTTGKENAPPPRSSRTSTEEQIDDMAVDDDVPRKSRPVSKSGSKVLGSAHDGAGDDVRDLKRKLSAITAERDRYRSQRDTYAKQFEELTKNKSDSEVMYDKLKEKAEMMDQAQSKTIEKQGQLLDKLQAKLNSLEKAAKDGLPNAGGVFESNVKADPKEVRALKDEMARLKSEVKEKDDRIAQVTREYKAEVEQSRLMQSTRGGSAAPAPAATTVSTTPEEAEKDAKSLALYEDLTMLNIANVKIKQGKAGSETTFNCIISIDGRSLNFKLRCYTEYDKDAKKYVKTVHYTPELLQHEPQAFRDKLDYFANEFQIPRDQLGGFFIELRGRMGDEGDDE
ncbi:hypothetical protein IAU60_005964 [Kwoniella sp. DSM 27419]